MSVSVSPSLKAPEPRTWDGTAGWAIAGALFVFGLALMFRHVFLAGASRSINDNGDGSIAIAILEHWFRVFGGHVVDWKAPEWYWPAPHPLSLTDTLFLLSLPYSTARAVGADWFAAVDVVVATLATLGFWGMVLLTLRGGVPPAIGAVFAFVFTFGVVPSLKVFHIQTFTMQLAPWLGLMLLAGWRGPRSTSLLWSASAGLLFGLMFFTAAQTPWFLGIEIALAGLLAGLFNVRALASLPRPIVVRAIQIGLSFAVGIMFGLVPFVVLYHHSLSLVREWEDVLVFSAYPLDFFNVPSGDLLWSRFLERLHIAGQPGRNEPEIALGWTPALAICAGLGFVLFGRIRRAAGPHPWDVVVRALLAAAALGPLISIHFRWFNLWYFVFRFVPGGHSIRTPFRIELAAALLLSLGLALVATRAFQAAADLKRAGLLATSGAVLALLVIEQIGAGPITRDSVEMRQWMTSAQRPAAPCEVFYLLPSNRLIWQEYQSDAMLLSQIIEMPTINGNSSFYPQGWNFKRTDKPEYASNALAWIGDHGLREHVCGIEPRIGKWVQGIQPLLDVLP